MQQNNIILFKWHLTPGSRSYSDLVDTWADSVYTQQLVLKPLWKAAWVM